MWGFHKAVCPLLITHNTVGVSQSSLPLLITHNTVRVSQSSLPLLITHNTVGVSQSSFPSADYPQYCGGFTKQFALCRLPQTV